MPDWTPAPVADLIRLLLTKDPKERMQNCVGEFIDCSSSDPDVYDRISYDTLRKHAFFSNWHEEVNQSQQLHYARQLSASVESLAVASDCSGLDSVEAITNVYNEAAHRVPSLHDLCLRAVANAAVDIAFATSDNGGIRPKLPWMQAFQLERASPLDFNLIGHLLDRKQQLHIPAVFRLFHNSLPETRCKRANIQRKEIVGFTRALQGHYTADYHFAQLHNPAIGRSLVDAQQAEDSVEETRLKASIANINKIRPKFVICFGHFTDNAQLDQIALWTRFRKCVARVSDTIPVIFVPGRAEMNHQIVTKSSILQYQSYFGADYFSFWFQGLKGIVINSSLMLDAYDATQPNGHALDCMEEAALQDSWLEEEIEQAKLCATNITLFSYHPFFYQDLDEDDMATDAPNGKVR